MADKLTKVTDPLKIVTDIQVIKELERQGIDKDYVEFHEDYCAAHPFQKIYKDKKSNKYITVITILPKVRKHDGKKIRGEWYKDGNLYRGYENLYDISVNEKFVSVNVLTNQPDGAQAGDFVSWNPQLYLDSVEIFSSNNNPTLLDVDPTNENLIYNTLEWDYGFCKRRIRLIEGRWKESWIIEERPVGDLRIKHNHTGSLQFRLGYGIGSNGLCINVKVIDNDEEYINATELLNASLPFTICASATFYPDASPESSSVDGRANHNDEGASWSTCRNGAGNYAADSESTEYGALMGRQWSYTDADTWRLVSRAFFLFNTSSLGASVTISAAVLSIYGWGAKDNGGWSPAAAIVSSNPASTTAIESGDFDSLGTTEFASINYASLSLTGYNDFTLNASGITAIAKTGVTKFGLREKNYDLANSEPLWSSDKSMHAGGYFSEQGAGYKPKLVITYTPPAPAAPTNVAASDGTYTDKITVTWTKSAGATNYRVYRDGANVSGTLGDVATYDYTGDAPTITPGTASASDGTSVDHVTLSLAGETANNGATATYTVYAYNEGGWSAASTGNTGYRSVGALVYLWYKSADDSDATYSSIGGATTDPYNDTGAPAPTVTPGTASASDGTSVDHVTLSLAGEGTTVGAGRYFKCYLTATGATAAYSTADRGYRGVGAIGYAWYRSAADSDASYGAIGGGTTDPYNDTGAPADGSGRYFKCLLAATGAESAYSTADRGFRDVPRIQCTGTSISSTTADMTITLGGVTELLTGTATAETTGVMSITLGKTESLTGTVNVNTPVADMSITIGKAESLSGYSATVLTGNMSLSSGAPESLTGTSISSTTADMTITLGHGEVLEVSASVIVSSQASMNLGTGETLTGTVAVTLISTVNVRRKREFKGESENVLTTRCFLSSEEDSDRKSVLVGY